MTKTIKSHKLIYAGERFNTHTGRLQQLFLRGEQELFWSGIKWVNIGHYYEAQEEGDRLTMKTDPEDAGEADVGEEKLTEWQLKTSAAKQRYKQVKSSKKIEKTYAYNRLVELFFEVSANLTYKEVRCLAEELSDAVLRKRDEKRNAEIMLTINKIRTRARKK